MRILIVSILLFLSTSCSSSKKSSSNLSETSEPKVMFDSDFDHSLIHGKWLTNSKRDKKNWLNFRENGFVLYDDGRFLKYNLEDNVILIYGKERVYKAFVKELNGKKLIAVLGDPNTGERITYYRP